MTSSSSSPIPLRIAPNPIRSNSIPPPRIRATNLIPISNSSISISIDPLRSRNSIASVPVIRRDDNECRPIISREKLDLWIRETVTEIVRGIEEAPFLAYVFAGESVRLEREAAEGGNWTEIKRRREERGEGRVPDGVILVEELSGEHAGGTAMEAAQRGRKTWGVVVQGRGRGAAECSACYILDTCRVRSAVGASTHFCLVRAKCFGESADLQLKKAWILP